MVSQVIYRLVFPAFELYFCNYRVQAIVVRTGWTVSILRITQLPKPVNNRRDGARNGRTVTRTISAISNRTGRTGSTNVSSPRRHYVPPFIGRDSLGCQNGFPKVRSLARSRRLRCSTRRRAAPCSMRSASLIRLPMKSPTFGEAYAHVTHRLWWICTSTVPQNRCIIIVRIVDEGTGTIHYLN